MAGKIIKEINFRRFKVLFDAINVEFPPILSPDLNFIILYKRYFNIYKYERHEIKNSYVEGIYISSENVISISKGDNVFMCTNGTYISQQYVCDGFVDCPEYDKLDEMGVNVIKMQMKIMVQNVNGLLNQFPRKPFVLDFIFYHWMVNVIHINSFHSIAIFLSIMMWSLSLSNVLMVQQFLQI